MDRKEFLSTLGLGAAFVLTSTCLGGCTKESVQDLGEVDFTIDLSDAQYTSLSLNGGYVVVDQVVIARDLSGNLIAATQRCSHENKYKIIYKNEEWYCTDHDARFSLSGDGLNGNGSKGLTTYMTSQDGDLLRVFS